VTNTILTGAAVAAHRASANLSREKYAQRCGLTVGGLWRIENKNTFKPGEVDLLTRTFPDLVNTSLINAETITSSTPVSATEPAIEPAVAAAEPPAVAATTTPHVVDRPPAPTVSMSPTSPVPSALFDEIQSLTAPISSPTTLSENDGKRRYSNSELGTFADCRRRWYLQYYRRLQLREPPVPIGVMYTGDRVHRALRYWYQPDGTPRIDPRDTIEYLISSARAMLVERYRNDPYTSGNVPEVVRKKFDASANLERIMIDGYLEWIADTGVDAEYTVIEPEAYIEGELPQLPDVLLIARIDVRVLRSTDGARLWLEHKTVGDLVSPTLTLPLDEQVLFQTLIEELQPDHSHHSEQYVAGVLYNMLRRVKRTAMAKPPFYGRTEVHHNPVTMDNYRKRVIGKITDVEATRSLLDENVDHRVVAYPRPTRECAWKCPMLAVCKMMDDGSHVESAISDMYQEGDPYGYYVDTMSTSTTPTTTP